MTYLIKYFITILSLIIGVISCTPDIRRFDATGTFEATEIIISAETNGTIVAFDADEGDVVTSGNSVVKINASNLALQKSQVAATIEAVQEKQGDPEPQVQILQERMLAANAQVQTLETQLTSLLKEQKRIERMYRAEAATEQQYDQVNGQVDVLNKQIETAKIQTQILTTQIKSAQRSVAIQNRGITSEIKPLEKKMDVIDDQLAKSNVVNPITGILLTKYAYKGEFVSVGKPLYKIADLSTMHLRAYIDGSQLNQIKLGDPVTVYIDQDDDYKPYEGKITWISDQAEFTPKTIQTKDERANLVYAIKVEVLNDGFLKIGMYGEVSLPQSDANDHQ